MILIVIYKNDLASASKIQTTVHIAWYDVGGKGKWKSDSCYHRITLVVGLENWALMIMQRAILLIGKGYMRRISRWSGVQIPARVSDGHWHRGRQLKASCRPGHSHVLALGSPTLAGSHPGHWPFSRMVSLLLLIFEPRKQRNCEQSKGMYLTGTLWLALHFLQDEASERLLGDKWARQMVWSSGR